MKSKSSQGKRAQASVSSEVEYDDVAMESLSGEDMEVEVDASTSSVGAADIGSTATQIKSPNGGPYL
ncbi:unnamed protein product [Linum trigynum]|uniref:Uncharacterized protein n=1 Tax=Linum trigynum TaxID=586398 RepID=A0AAV2CIJ4_9ROSI